MNSTALFPTDPIRLAEISVCNWGSFQNIHTAKIDPHGTLITGDNGAGKSTFIDGLMALLLPMRGAAFNVAAAQGDKSDRSVLSYVRGSFGADHEGANTRVKHKRDGAVISALRALYRSENGNEITLLTILLLNAGANSLSEIKRIYLVAKGNVRLPEVLQALSEGNIRAFNQWLKTQKHITSFDERFKDYQAYYRQCLSMDNENAPALLSRALGLKKIDDLTKLIRELVLEPSNIRDEARKIVAEFDDLAHIHARMLDARAQVNHLKDLPHLQEKWQHNQQQVQSLSAQRQALPIYYAQYRTERLREHLAVISGSLKRAEQEIITQKQRVQYAQEMQEQRHAEYLQAGGERIAVLSEKEKNQQKEYDRIIQAAENYQVLCRQLNICDDVNHDIFAQHQTQADEQMAILAQAQETAEQQFGLEAGKLSLLNNQIYDLQDEIAKTEQQKSSLPNKQQQWRDEVQAAFNIAPNTLMFIAEMVEVAEKHRDWQGAIERAMGGLRTTLLVPKSEFHKINQWLNTRHMGTHIRVQEVDLDKTQDVEFKEKGYLAKLVWREHVYQNWLRGFLHQKDVFCAENMAEFERTPFSMTREGLQHWERGRSEKKDNYKINDKNQWFLGFSNKTRLGSLKSELAHIQAEKIAQTQKLNQAREQMNRIATQKSLWEKFIHIQWTDIDVPQIEFQLNETRAQIAALLHNQGNMQLAKQRWEEAKQHSQAVQMALIQANKEEQSWQEKQQHTERELQQYAEKAQLSIRDDVRALLVQYFEKKSVDEPTLRATQQHLENLHDKAQAQCADVEKKAERIMSAFRHKPEWQAYAVEWATDFQAALPDYIAHLRHLQNEGLPELVEQQTERLNKHSTQSLMSFEEMFIKIHQDIQERIQKINAVLARTEFMQAHHYLRLGQKNEHYPHVKEFRQKVAQARKSYISEDQDLRFRQLQDVIEVLKKHMDSNTLESQRLLDPRYQLDFYADVVDKHDEHRVIETLSSSSGKSGGEKEAFAGMIVAASLAYVLTPEGSDRPVYCTVFLDEAFSNTAENVSRRVLRVFKALGLHVNLITPYKNLNLAQESARSVIIAERNSLTHESHLCEMTWEELDKQRLKGKT
ncbi:MAG: ATP-binding protein [Alysiella sp.]|uniref:ATP-binding protein n=1 Tax=Alysiella sp. TaxID=1872483 RepID=UPI0026DDA15D|nr:ATP-binding protein [Alysiella sp.]MDO4433213.1 ATP-binding protein [Alysiella sp.]